MSAKLDITLIYNGKKYHRIKIINDEDQIEKANRFIEKEYTLLREEETPMIQITAVKVKSVTFTQSEDGKVTVAGEYHLLDNRGKTIAKQAFNGYDTIKIDFNVAFGKDVLDTAESTIETQIGIQEILHTQAPRQEEEEAI